MAHRVLIVDDEPQIRTVLRAYLEADGFVLRTAHQVVPPHVDYELTPLGIQAAERVVALVGWIEGALPEIMAGKMALAAE